VAKRVGAGVDNAIYDRLASEWWDECGGLHLLKTVMNPWRLPYFQRALARTGLDPRGAPALDVGCGGGLLAEEFAAMGCAVTGIDPSESSLAAARAHAEAHGLRIEYRHGYGDALPLADGEFAIVYCCDVLEHIQNWDAVIGEMARVLAPGGVLLFDTINRTLLSNLVAIKLLQEWRLTSVFPPRFHAWAMFIRPQELRASLARHGLRAQAFSGTAIRLHLIRLLRAMRGYRAGKIPASVLGRHLSIREGRLMSLSYLGYAVK
jgi:2-polyprenyl-6-hydroxyphenyl methylase / 3-demethylubiquinone-9 3-methyltransferase